MSNKRGILLLVTIILLLIISPFIISQVYIKDGNLETNPPETEDGWEPVTNADQLKQAEKQDLNQYWEQINSEIKNNYFDNHPEDAGEKVNKDNFLKTLENDETARENTRNQWNKIKKGIDSDNEKSEEITKKIAEKDLQKNIGSIDNPQEVNWKTDANGKPVLEYNKNEVGTNELSNLKEINLQNGKAQYTFDQVSTSSSTSSSASGSTSTLTTQSSIDGKSVSVADAQRPPTPPNQGSCPGGSCQPETGQQPTSTGDGSSGGGLGSGGLEEFGKELLGVMEQIANFVSKFESLKPKGDQSPASQQDPSLMAPLDELYGEAEAATAQMHVDATADGAYFLFSGDQLESEEKDGSKKAVSVPNTDAESAEVTINGESLENLQVSNTKTTLYQDSELVADVYTPAEPSTEILFSSTSGTSQELKDESSSLSEKYYPSITAAAISPTGSNQYAHFIEYNLALGGQRLLVNIYKSFNQVNADGQDLWIKDGDVTIKFQGAKIYYPRRIKDSYYNLGLIQNPQDNSNTKFQLIQYQENQARLIDLQKRVSVGDMTTEHPRNPNLAIAKVREDLWVER